MIKEVKLEKELVVTEKNRVGILANISKILADHGLNIEGVAGYAAGDDARIMIVVDDTLRAKEALEEGGYKAVKEHEVVVVGLENKSGALKGVTAKLAAEKIDIKYTYGTVSSEGCPARIVFSTTNDEKVLVLFKTK